MNYGRYQVIEELGQGAMGLVYRAHDPQIDRQVALKVLRRDRITGEDFVNRFLKEARVIGRLSHPNIVTVYDAGQEGPDVYIAMEFVEGSALNEILRIIPLSLQRIVEIGIQAAQTLDYAHAKGVVHRDIKPSNILLQSDKNIKITDFGIAHLEDATDTLQTRQDEIMGMPAYMSPEQAQGQLVDGRADIFSLGAVLYELTTGRRPFGGPDKNIAAVLNEIIHQDPPAPAAIAENVAGDLSAIIMKCLSKDPARRYQTGNELAQALKQYLAGPAPQVSDIPPVGKKKKSYVIPVAAAAAAVLILVAGIYVYSQYSGRSVQKPAHQQENVPIPPSTSPEAPPEAKQTTPLAAVKPAPVSMPAPSPVVVAPVAKPEAKMKPAEPQRKKQEDKRSPVVVPTGKQPRTMEAQKQQPQAREAKPSVSLTPVTIKSNPPGAGAYIDGTFKGTTPVTVMVPVGKHHMRIARPGYADAQKDVMIEETMEYPLSFHLKTAGESD